MKLVSITRIGDRVVIIPSDTTSQGWHVESSEHVELARGTSVDSIVSSVIAAFSKVQVGIPTPSRSEQRVSKLPQNFGVGTHRDMVALGPVHVSVLILEDESVVVTPYVPVADGFDPISERKIRFESISDGLESALSQLLLCE